MNNFEADNDFSKKASDEEFWDQVYREAFPHMNNHMTVDGECQAQYLGVDRIIVMKSGKKVQVDEKKRRKCYGDILLEYISNDKTNSPGWINKHLHIDYMAYAFMPDRRVYLFDWLILRRVWHYYSEKWKQLGREGSNGFSIVKADNPGYTTHSVAVPIPVLTEKVKGARVIDLNRTRRRLS